MFFTSDFALSGFWQWSAVRLNLLVFAVFCDASFPIYCKCQQLCISGNWQSCRCLQLTKFHDPGIPLVPWWFMVNSIRKTNGRFRLVWISCSKSSPLFSALRLHKFQGTPEGRLGKTYESWGFLSDFGWYMVYVCILCTVLYIGLCMVWQKEETSRNQRLEGN